MHVIPPYEPQVILKTWDGITRVYASRQAALQALGRHYIRYRVGPRIDIDLRWSTMFTEQGVQLFAVDFDDQVAPPRLSYLRGRFDTWNGNGPVPGTGRRGGGHHYRRPQTMSERRLNAFHDAEAGEPRARARRCSLPSNYDDLSISSYGHHSWKRHRKTQWKEKAEKV